MIRMPIPTIRQALAALQIVTLATLFFTITPGAAYSGPSNPKTISIAEARSLPLGTVVTIDGSVTVPSGAFNSSSFDQVSALCATEARAQCVCCTPHGGVFNCDPCTKGGAHCMTNSELTSCVLDGACGGELESLPIQAKFRISKEILVEIAKVQPRFAVIMAFVNEKNLLARRHATVFMIPKEVSEEDVARAINPEMNATKVSPKTLKRRDGGIADPVIPLQYQLTVEELPDSATRVARLQVVKGYDLDPPFSTLEINFVTKKKTCKANSWRIISVS